MKLAQITLLFSFLIFASGCGSSHPILSIRLQSKHSSNLLSPKPHLGVLVENVSEQQLITILENNPESTYRYVSQLHNIVEFFNLSADLLKKDLPPSSISNNHLIKSITPQPKEDHRHLVEMQISKTSSSPTQFFKPCKASKTADGIEIDFKIKKKTEGKMLQTGDAFEFQIKPNLRGIDHQKVAWIVLHPEVNIQKEEFFAQNTLLLKLDSVGLYTVIAVTQDHLDVCRTASIEIPVTSNPKYLGVLDNKFLKENLSLKPFGHLHELNVIEAWRTSSGKGVKIAIIDSGVNYNHDFLRNNIALNLKEVPNNNQDDDQNGYVDDLLGWDFSNDDAYPYDDIGHGTMVAGLAASDLMGIAKSSTYIPIKIINSAGTDSGSLISAIYYAVDRGAQIINLSMISLDKPSRPLLNAIQFAELKNVLIVTAAGNGDHSSGIGYNSDVKPVYPGALPSKNILNVTASGSSRSVTSYSNYGPISVDMIAPGGDIKTPLISLSTADSEKYPFRDGMGTSFAAPIVAGAAAMIWEKQSKATFLEVKHHLMKQGTYDENLGKVVQSKRWFNFSSK